MDGRFALRSKMSIASNLVTRRPRNERERTNRDDASTYERNDLLLRSLSKFLGKQERNGSILVIRK